MPRGQAGATADEAFGRAPHLDSSRPGIREIYHPSKRVGREVMPGSSPTHAAVGTPLLEMQVAPVGSPPGAGERDRVAFADDVARPDQHLPRVPDEDVEGPAAFDHPQSERGRAVRRTRPARAGGVDDPATGAGKDRRPAGQCDVDAVVEAPAAAPRVRCVERRRRASVRDHHPLSAVEPRRPVPGPVVGEELPTRVVGAGTGGWGGPGRLRRGRCGRRGCGRRGCGGGGRPRGRAHRGPRLRGLIRAVDHAAPGQRDEQRSRHGAGDGAHETTVGWSGCFVARNPTRGPGQESVWGYPRPPALRRCTSGCRSSWAGPWSARPPQSWQVLETSHPPTYYLPRDSFIDGSLRPAAGGSYCEWKGPAGYLDVVGGRVASAAAWYYPQPESWVRDAGRPRRAVRRPDGPLHGRRREVRPQSGGFYGGWITSNVTGPFRGVPGSNRW